MIDLLAPLLLIGLALTVGGLCTRHCVSGLRSSADRSPAAAGPEELGRPRAELARFKQP